VFLEAHEYGGGGAVEIPLRKIGRAIRDGDEPTEFVYAWVLKGVK
jgi:hypothetical protein